MTRAHRATGDGRSVSWPFPGIISEVLHCQHCVLRETVDLATLVVSDDESRDDGFLNGIARLSGTGNSGDSIGYEIVREATHTIS